MPQSLLLAFGKEGHFQRVGLCLPGLRRTQPGPGCGHLEFMTKVDTAYGRVIGIEVCNDARLEDLLDRVAGIVLELLSRGDMRWTPLTKAVLKESPTPWNVQ